MDNYYENCPAKMGIDYGLTDFRSPTVVNEDVKYKNNIVTEKAFASEKTPIGRKKIPS